MPLFNKSSLELPNDYLYGWKRRRMFGWAETNRALFGGHKMRAKLTSRTILIVTCGLFLLFLILLACLDKSMFKPRKPTKAFCPSQLQERHRCHILPYLLSSGGSFAAALRSRADENGVVMLSSIDSFYVDIALNFYKTSLRPHRITNHLFVCTNAEAQRQMTAYGLPCYLYDEVDSDSVYGNKTSNTVKLYGMPEFVRQANLKTKLVLSALILGYTVFFVDVDLVFFKNPLHFMHCDYCDLLMMLDSRHVINTGLYIVRPTERAIKVHTTILENNMCDAELTQQTSFNHVFYDDGSPLQGYIRLEILETDQFPSGMNYFEKGHRMFAGDNPCHECVALHNNWIVSKEAKVYRFKEHHMWAMDFNGYYSDNSAKYLTYDNPFDLGEQTTEVEMMALKSALFLGHLLKRIVVLPVFHCYGCTFDVCKGTQKCSLQVNWRIDAFDKEFALAYREHSFLYNRMVPDSVKNATGKLLIKSKYIMDRIGKAEAESVAQVFLPENPARGAEPEEIINWFGKPPLSDYPTLKFHSLYLAVAGPVHFPEKFGDFTQKLKKAFAAANYRQT